MLAGCPAWGPSITVQAVLESIDVLVGSCLLMRGKNGGHTQSLGIIFKGPLFEGAQGGSTPLF